ncbi:hypothetical protein SAMN06265365_15111 [Tistlia consotensis]|uniref:Alpha/beta hydrolase family protein n=1 Tax=Tistlia consotensis USBA 355 TaxID=560819 RepID=A0A1Y6CXP4_9PROT|nr:hypothetical protein [Tistlia consotensis]SMF83771.1 hypothetical protein SAMN05428998_15111 [Tistlia consotensis USBA 355]SNS34339.1 hypothetical protein SAMN06265365_15111 [Tistlia consotensis]
MRALRCVPAPSRRPAGLLPGLLGLLVLLAAPPAGAASLEATPVEAAPVEGAWLGPVGLADPADPLSLTAPGDLLLVIYNHGSRAEFRQDRCDPTGGGTPPAVAGLAGRPAGRLTVAVFAFCTRTRLGRFDERTGEGEPKVVLRAAEIAGLAARFAAAGVPPRRIVLAGQSAGGWASLLAAARSGEPLGGVIAFAPAFAGKAAGRPARWRQLRDAQAAELAARPRLPALVYAFPGDRFEPPADLAFLAGVPDLTLVTWQPPAGVACARHEAHLGAFTDCFRAAEEGRLLGFLAERARTAGGA